MPYTRPVITHQPQSSLSPIEHYEAQLLAATFDPVPPSVESFAASPGSSVFGLTLVKASSETPQSDVRLWYDAIKSLVLPAFLALLEESLHSALPQVDIPSLIQAGGLLRDAEDMQERFDLINAHAGVQLSPAMASLLDLAIEVRGILHDEGQPDFAADLLTPLRLLRNLMRHSPEPLFEGSTQTLLDSALPRLIKLFELLKKNATLELGDSTFDGLMKVLTPFEVIKIALPENLQWLPEFYEGWATVLQAISKPDNVTADHAYARPFAILRAALGTSFGGLVAEQINARLGCTFDTMRELGKEFVQQPYAQAVATLDWLETSIKSGYGLAADAIIYLEELIRSSATSVSLDLCPTAASIQQKMAWGMQFLLADSTRDFVMALLPDAFTRRIYGPIAIGQRLVQNRPPDETMLQATQRLVEIANDSADKDLFEEDLGIPLEAAVQQVGYWIPLGQELVDQYRDLPEQASGLAQAASMTRALVGMVAREVKALIQSKVENGTLIEAALPALAMMLFYVSGERPKSFFDATRLAAITLVNKIPIVQTLYSAAALMKLVFNAFWDLRELIGYYLAPPTVEGETQLQVHFSNVLKHLAEWSPALLRFTGLLLLLPEVYRLLQEPGQVGPESSQFKRLTRVLLAINASTDPFIQSYASQIRALLVSKMTGIEYEKVARLTATLVNKPGSPSVPVQGAERPGAAPTQSAISKTSLTLSSSLSQWVGGGKNLLTFLGAYGMVTSPQGTAEDASSTLVSHEELSLMDAASQIARREGRLHTSTKYIMAGASALGLAGLSAGLGLYWSRHAQTASRYDELPMVERETVSNDASDERSTLSADATSETTVAPGWHQRAWTYTKQNKAVVGAYGAAAAFGLLGVGLVTYGALEAATRKRREEEVSDILDSPIWAFEDTTFTDEVHDRLKQAYPSDDPIYDNPSLLAAAIERIVQEPLDTEEAGYQPDADNRLKQMNGRIRVKRAGRGGGGGGSVTRGRSTQATDKSTVANTAKLTPEEAAKALAEKIALRKETDAQILSAYDEFMEESFDIPMNLLNEHLYIEKLGQEILDRHHSKRPPTTVKQTHFDSDAITHVSFRAWVDKPDEIFEDLVPRWRVSGLKGNYAAMEGYQRVDDYRKKGTALYNRKYFPDKTSKPITWGKLLRGMRKHELGRNTNTATFEDPFFKELDDTDTPVKHLEELQAFYAAHMPQLENAASLKAKRVLRDALGREDYDPVERIESGNAKLYRVGTQLIRRNNNLIGTTIDRLKDYFMVDPYFDIAEYVDEKADIDYIVFFSTGNKESVRGYANKQEMAIHKFESVVELMNGINARITSGKLDTVWANELMDYLVSQLSNEQLSKARKLATARDAPFTPDFVENLKKFRDEKAGERHVNRGKVIIRRLEQVSLSGIMLPRIKRMKELSVIKMDRATMSKDEDYWMDVLHRIDFYAGLVVEGLKHAAAFPYMPPKIKTGLYASAMVLHTIVATATNVTRAMIDAVDGSAEDALLEWMMTMYGIVYDKLVKVTLRSNYAKNEAHKQAIVFVRFAIDKAKIKDHLLTKAALAKFLSLTAVPEPGFKERQQASTRDFEELNKPAVGRFYKPIDLTSTESEKQAEADRASRARLQEAVDEDQRTVKKEARRQRRYELLSWPEKQLAQRKRDRQRALFNSHAPQRAENSRALTAMKAHIRRRDSHLTQQQVHSREKQVQINMRQQYDRSRQQKQAEKDRENRRQQREDDEKARELQAEMDYERLHPELHREVYDVGTPNTEPSVAAQAPPMQLPPDQEQRMGEHTQQVRASQADAVKRRNEHITRLLEQYKTDPGRLVLQDTSGTDAPRVKDMSLQEAHAELVIWQEKALELNLIITELDRRRKVANGNFDRAGNLVIKRQIKATLDAIFAVRAEHVTAKGKVDARIREVQRRISHLRH